MNKDIKPHGGDIYESLLEGKPEPLDFSANISPLGLPEGVKRALAGHAAEFERYPDPHCRVLVSALSQKHGLSTSQIVCGAGSADLIFRIAQVCHFWPTWSEVEGANTMRPFRALVTAPAFSEYEKALTEAGAEIHHYPLYYPGFDVRDNILDKIPGKEAVFLCNPNNPTGVLTSSETIKSIVYACENAGATLILDECFMDLTDNPEEYTAEPLLGTHKNLIILKAFTKTFAMAGLRLGYALCGSTGAAQSIKDIGPPWSVSVPAQIAGLQALAETAYLEKLRALIKTERERLKKGLSDTGAEILGGSANYIFFRVQKALAEKLPQNLAANGVLIRSCSNYIGLEDGSYFRVAVKLPEENDRLLHLMKELASGIA